MNFLITFSDVIISVLFLLFLIFGKGNSSVYIGGIYLFFPLIRFIEVILNTNKGYLNNLYKYLFMILITFVLLIVGSIYGKKAGYYYNVDSSLLMGLYGFSCFRILLIILLIIVSMLIIYFYRNR